MHKVNQTNSILIGVNYCGNARWTYGDDDMYNASCQFSHVLKYQFAILYHWIA